MAGKHSARTLTAAPEHAPSRAKACIHCSKIGLESAKSSRRPICLAAPPAAPPRPTLARGPPQHEAAFQLSTKPKSPSSHISCSHTEVCTSALFPSCACTRPTWPPTVDGGTRLRYTCPPPSATGTRRAPSSPPLCFPPLASPPLLPATASPLCLLETCHCDHMPYTCPHTFSSRTGGTTVTSTLLATREREGGICG